VTNKRILILGNFGYVTGHLDGQTMESRSLLQLLRDKGVKKVTYFDTEELSYNKSQVLVMFLKVILADKLFYLGAQRNLRVLFPYIFLCTKLFRTQFYFFVVGGWIAENLKDKPFHRFLLKFIEGMYCETESIVKKLREWYGYTHAHWFPNFRNSTYTPSLTSNRADLSVFKLVFMSRIVLKKGFDVVFRLAEYMESSFPKGSFLIDFYGPLYDADKAAFFDGIDRFYFTSYKGVLQPEEINACLEKYDVMLFPTRYEGEGFPGTILDAYISGIPVIASDWRYNAELVEHAQTGYIFDLQDESAFYKAVKELYDNPEILGQMKQKAHIKSKENSAEAAWDIIMQHTKINQ